MAGKEGIIIPLTETQAKAAGLDFVIGSRAAVVVPEHGPVFPAAITPDGERAVIDLAYPLTKTQLGNLINALK